MSARSTTPRRKPLTRTVVLVLCAGLSAVRESILWEVGFAPEACRSERVHGLVLFTLPGGRLAVGAPDWRWSDLLKPAGRATAP